MNERDEMQQSSISQSQGEPQGGRRETRPVELFAVDDLAGLRDELRQSGLDTWQVAAMIGNFLTQRGYGVSHDACKSAAQNEVLCGSLDRMQAGLAALALSM